MATGDSCIDGIELAETTSAVTYAEDLKNLKSELTEDDGKDKSSGIPPPLDMSAAVSLQNASGPKTPTGISRHKSERERKIGHRRVGVGGEITYKKIQTSQIMGSIQLGIQHAVGGLASKPERDLLMQDFMTVETTNFPSDGSSHTPAHHYSEFRFRTYAPIAFRYFRDLFGIQPDDFLISMCSAPMRELSNPGASGSIFYLTEDDEFIIKTVQHKEGEFLQKLLPGYYLNLNQNPRTLLPKFFGLYCYQCNSKNVRLVVMNNLLPSTVRLHQKYDLKGSTYKRKASKTERQKSSPTFKDLDFIDHHPEGIGLEADTYTAMVKTIQRDCRVLESFKIMDYSLLVGIHNLDQAAREKAERRSANVKASEGTASGEPVEGSSGDADCERDVGGGRGSTALNRSRSINRQRLVAHSTAMESIQAESEPIDEEDDVPPGGIPARNSRGERLLLFIGIIDILQSYRLKKKLEHTWKAMIHDGDTVSVHRPGFYAQRFEDFMSKTVFKKIPSRQSMLRRIRGKTPLDLPEIKGNHRKFRTLVTSYIALKHSPSKRKSISRPMRSLEMELGDTGAAAAGGSVSVTLTAMPTAGKPAASPPGAAATGAAPAPTPVSAPIAIPSALTPASTIVPSATPVSAASLLPAAATMGGASLAQPAAPPPLQPSPPSYPAVLKDRPPSFSKGHGTAPGAPGAKIPPPVPPRGSSPHSRRGSFRFGQQMPQRSSLRRPARSPSMLAPGNYSSSSGSHSHLPHTLPSSAAPRAVTFSLDAPPPTYEVLTSSDTFSKALYASVVSTTTESPLRVNPLSEPELVPEAKAFAPSTQESSASFKRTTFPHLCEPPVVSSFSSSETLHSVRSFASKFSSLPDENSNVTTSVMRSEQKYLTSVEKFLQSSVTDTLDPHHYLKVASSVERTMPSEISLQLTSSFVSHSSATPHLSSATMLDNGAAAVTLVSDVVCSHAIERCSVVASSKQLEQEVVVCSSLSNPQSTRNLLSDSFLLQETQTTKKLELPPVPTTVFDGYLEFYDSKDLV